MSALTWMYDPLSIVWTFVTWSHPPAGVPKASRPSLTSGPRSGSMVTGPM